jgi:methylaspartate mutase epsilon subunit
MKITNSKKTRRIAIIGSGPRGMSVLERLASRINGSSDENEIIDIYLIDNGYVGTGRVWAPDQSSYLLMNTVAQEISAFSGLWDKKNIRPGNGPSFAQWWKFNYDDYEQYGGYAPRAYYGKYLLFVLSVIEKSLPESINLHKINGRVDSMYLEAETQILTFSDGKIITVDRTVIVTGHSINKLAGIPKKLREFADGNNEVKFLSGNYSVSGLNLTSIKPKENVGVIGMGLSFYDLMAELTLGRKGKFIKAKDGTLVYQASGKEPHLFVGSRSGMPIPARGKNQKPFDYEYQPAIFTMDRALKIKERGHVHFDRDVLPLIEAEVALVYTEIKLRNEYGLNQAEKLRHHVIKHNVTSVEGVNTFAKMLGMSGPNYIDLTKLKNPFKGCYFDSIDEFNKIMAKLLLLDYEEAIKGNLNSPLKGSLDVLRNIRSAIRAVVDFGGLAPKSYKEEFLKRFAPIANFLAAGPPAFRIVQLRALILAGIVTIVGPSTRFEISEENHQFHISSSQVQGSNIAVKTIIDARVPVPNLKSDCSKLTQSLQKKGIITSFTNKDDNVVFETNGVNVTQSPYHPIDKNDAIVNNVYVLGIPTEYTRWFMQSGSTRPNRWIDFMIDADAIADDALSGKISATTNKNRGKQNESEEFYSTKISR